MAHTYKTINSVSEQDSPGKTIQFTNLFSNSFEVVPLITGLELDGSAEFFICWQTSLCSDQCIAYIKDKKEAHVPVLKDKEYITKTTNHWLPGDSESNSVSFCSYYKPFHLSKYYTSYRVELKQVKIRTH